VFEIDRVSSECMSLILEYLTWFMDGLVGLWYSRVGVVPSGVTANFYPPNGENPNYGVGPLSGRMTHQHSYDLGTLRGKNFYSRVGPPSGKKS